MRCRRALQAGALLERRRPREGLRARDRRGEVRRRAQQADDGRVAMVELRHRVEQVRDQTCAVVDGLRRDIGGRDAMSAA